MADAAGKNDDIISHGLRFPNDPAVISRKARRLLRAEAYESREFNAVTALLNKRDVVLELGAGIGFMSTVVSKLCRVAAVHAYEANPALIPYIHSVHALNGVKNATVVNALLAPDKGKPVNFYVRQDFLASSMQAEQGGDSGGVISVEKIAVHSINQVMKDLKPTVLVCDIEGAEADLLPATDLSSLRCAIIELHPQWIKKHGVQQVFDAMHGAGLTFYPRTSNKKVVTFRKDW